MFSTNGGGDNADRQLRQACAELVRRLQAGQPCHAEDFLTTLPASASGDESVLELIYTEYVVREGLGQKPDPAEWYARFPQWRERLERLFHVGELMRAESDSEVATVFFTPPLGMNLFVASYRFEKAVLTVIRACWPFFVIQLAAVLLITYWPQLSLVLVR